MPELPEVETVKRSLAPFIIGREIKAIEFYRPNIRNQLPFDKITKCQDAKILEVKRLAKYLVINLSTSYSLIIHLGMTGKIYFEPHDYILKKHDHVKITLDHGSIIFNDTRRFGVFDIISSSEIEKNNYFKNIGLDPLVKEFNSEYLKDKLKKRSLAIKAALMDNAVVVGVGNIYASESLFLARINPLIKASMLNNDQLKKLVESIKIILLEAIEAGGSTIKDYKTPDGSSGYFQMKFKVYGKTTCQICQKKLQKIKIAGRTTYFCDTCQPE